MRLFFYGVLQGPLASPAIRKLLSGLGPGRRAVVQGWLYAIHHPHGCYPALLPGEWRVSGMLHEAGSIDLVALDRFELYDPADPEGSEYIRREIAVRMPAGGAARAGAYIYCRPVTPRMERIAHGDFVRWLAETGNSPFTP